MLIQAIVKTEVVPWACNAGVRTMIFYSSSYPNGIAASSTVCPVHLRIVPIVAIHEVRPYISLDNRREAFNMARRPQVSSQCGSIVLEGDFNIFTREQPDKEECLPPQI